MPSPLPGKTTASLAPATAMSSLAVAVEVGHGEALMSALPLGTP